MKIVPIYPGSGKAQHECAGGEASTLGFSTQDFQEQAMKTSQLGKQG